MKVIEKNAGQKIDYAVDGTKIIFADGALSIDIERYQNDVQTTRDIMVDNEGYLTTGRGRYYAAQIEIPAAEYKETIVEQDDVAGDAIIRERMPLDMDNVTLYLFGIDGIIIH